MVYFLAEGIRRFIAKYEYGVERGFSLKLYVSFNL